MGYTLIFQSVAGDAKKWDPTQIPEHKIETTKPDAASEVDGIKVWEAFAKVWQIQQGTTYYLTCKGVVVEKDDYISNVVDGNETGLGIEKESVVNVQVQLP